MFAGSLPLAAQPAGRVAAAAGSQAVAVVLGINEGVTYRVTPAEVRERYRDIADDLARQLRRPVTIEYMDDYAQMGRDLQASRFDLAFVHPAHYAIRAIAEAHYRLVAVTRGYSEYKVSFLVRDDATIKSLADPSIRAIGLPDEDSITAWITRATLRDAVGQGSIPRLRYTRYQDAVPFMLEHGFAEVGATAAAGVIKNWTDKGGKVMLQSKPVPIKALIASPNLPTADLARVQHYFLSLDQSEEGQRRLAKLGYKGFQLYDEKAYAELGRWLGALP